MLKKSDFSWNIPQFARNDRGSFSGVHIVDPAFTRIGIRKPEQLADRRRLSRSIRTEKTENLPFLNRKGDVEHAFATLIYFGQIQYIDHHITHFLTLTVIIYQACFEVNISSNIIPICRGLLV